MAIQILRLGSEGPDVERWQNFLIGLRHLRDEADGDFGPLTEKATKAFQRTAGITADGIVGPRTLGAALLAGFDAGFEDKVDLQSNPVLPAPSSIEPLSLEDRKEMFGEFHFEPAPTSQNPEKIRILDDWEEINIKTVFIPQLKGIPVFGQPSSGRMRFHQKAAEQLKAMWESWQESSLLDLVLTYDGSYNPRFVRGSRTNLSNHAFGSAFDINYQWNKMGAIPALEGEKGSVRELVAIAAAHGFYWGGNFQGRPDGMHFEVAKLI
ncbi:MAG: M15 family metallopeptidase [Desulfobulbaceae bacterium]|nr:M15 family metallopeptidase [Pseudomonadota bacterium]MCG2746989.1 M15 family metallopeptidase [Desulfobulbaceae bacterium]